MHRRPWALLNDLFIIAKHCIAAMFHGQVTDYIGFTPLGAFLANPGGGSVPPGFRVGGASPCTDLSTSDVDNGGFPFKTDTCAHFVMEQAVMPRKLPGVAPPPWTGG